MRTSSNTRITCRVCGGPLFGEPILSLVGMPKAAQKLPTIPNKDTIDLDLFACSLCGTVQLTCEPVPYWNKAIRSDVSEEQRTYRKNQVEALAEEYYLHSKNHLDIRTTNLAGSFEIFTCLNFMEHWPEPGVVLRRIHDHLDDHGVGIVEVPNFEMITQERLYTEIIPDHLLYFTKKTLRHILERNGFEVVKCGATHNEYVLSATVEKRQNWALTPFESVQIDFLDQLDYFLENKDRVAVYGAGHQALATLAMLDLGDRITYVVDDDPAKWDRYTPATGVPIHHSGKLIEDPVEGIIVLVGSYEEEVVKKIKQMCKNVPVFSSNKNTEIKWED